MSHAVRTGGRWQAEGRPGRRCQPYVVASDTNGAAPVSSPAAEGTRHVSTVSQTIAAPLKHSRLTTFFRYILFIPLAIVNWLYAIAAYIAVIVAWFAIVFT